MHSLSEQLFAEYLGTAASVFRHKFSKYSLCREEPSAPRYYIKKLLWKIYQNSRSYSPKLYKERTPVSSTVAFLRLPKMFPKIFSAEHLWTTVSDRRSVNSCVFNLRRSSTKTYCTNITAYFSKDSHFTILQSRNVVSSFLPKGSVSRALNTSLHFIKKFK